MRPRCAYATAATHETKDARAVRLTKGTVSRKRAQDGVENTIAVHVVANDSGRNIHGHQNSKSNGDDAAKRLSLLHVRLNRRESSTSHGRGKTQGMVWCPRHQTVGGGGGGGGGGKGYSSCQKATVRKEPPPPLLASRNLTTRPRVVTNISRQTNNKFADLPRAKNANIGTHKAKIQKQKKKKNKPGPEHALFRLGARAAPPPLAVEALVHGIITGAAALPPVSGTSSPVRTPIASRSHRLHFHVAVVVVRRERARAAIVGQPIAMVSV